MTVQSGAITAKISGVLMPKGDNNELVRLNAQVAVYSTARNAYSAALKDLLPKSLS